MPLSTQLSERISTAIDLSGRTAVITGAGGGLGRESAFVLGEAGASLAVIELEQSDVDSLVAELSAAGHEVRGVTADVTNAVQMNDAISSVLAETHQIDILVNAAGIIGKNDNVADVDIADLEKIIAVNVTGTFISCQAVLPHMLAREQGSIINLASGAIDFPTASRAPYSLTKAAVAQLTKNLAMEVSPQGVRVNALAPGFFPSRMTSRHWLKANGEVDEQRREEVRKEMAQAQALPVLGEPFDQALLVLYLASEASRFVTGQIMRANGGLAMPW